MALGRIGVCRNSAAVIALYVALAAGAATAQTAKSTWIEPRYDPPVGSRWNVIIDYRRDEATDGKPAVLAYTTRSELTIDAKTGDGFCITFVNRDMQVSGTTSSVPLMKAVAATLKGSTVRAATDASGKPLRIENFAELRPMMQQAIDAAVAARGDKQPGKDLLRNILTRLLLGDSQQATTTYLGELGLLALGHNTGLKLGQERRTVEESANPTGGAPMHTNQILKLVEADAATGKARFLFAEAYDPASVRAMIAEAVRRMMAAQGRNGDEAAARTDALLKTVKITRDEHTGLAVDSGMTRSLRSDKNTTSTGLGVTYVKHESKTVTVTPLR